MKEICWGILGAGNIAQRFAASIANVDGAHLVAASARSPKKGTAFAKTYGVERIYTAHEDLLEDDGIDVVYISVPHLLHCEWTERALEAGKAVMCEKPAGLNAAEAERMIAAARKAGLPFMEAMKTRFVPAHDEIVSLVQAGALGDLVSIEASWCINVPAREGFPIPGNGGALIDCGVYCTSWIEELLPDELNVEKVDSRVVDGADFYTRAELSSGGVRAVIEAAFDRDTPRMMTITGKTGKLEVDNFHRPVSALLKYENHSRTIEAPYDVDDFHGEIEHMSSLVRNGVLESAVMPHSATLRCAQIADKIAEKF